ncbi:ribonuclease H-like domain-containing protein [Chytridium lagenaria]|nr:ribonuclease H-like domain-containing protein [Chytridium lagenaria]
MNANSDSYDFASGLGRYAYQLASSGSFPECAVIIREFLSGSLLKCLNPPSRFHNIEPDQIMTALDMMVNADDVQNVAEALMVNQKGFGTFEKVLQDQLQELIRMFLFRIEETCFKLWSDLEESLNLNPGTRLKSDNSNPQSLTRYSNHLCTLAFRLKFVKSNSELLALFPAGSAGSRRSKVFWLITEVQRIVQEWTFGHISTDSEPESDESQLKASAVKEIDSILELLGMIVNGVDDRFSNCLSKHVLSMLLETCDRSDGELLKNAMLWVAEEFASQFKLEPFLVAAKESVGDGGGSGLKGRDKKMDSKKHLPVYQGRYPVTYVDDAEKLLLVLALLRKPSPVDVADPASPGGSSLAAIVSLDCEWAPDVLSLTTASSATVPASILQMGIEDADGNRSIFVLALDCLPAADVELMLTGLFNSKKIKKLGFGLEQDISKLGVLYPQIPRTLKYLKDLSTVPKNELAKFKTPENNVKHGGKIGLADLCHWVLKKRLSKSARISNWNRRPLKEQQIQYAANDVAVLLDIYALLRTP